MILTNHKHKPLFYKSKYYKRKITIKDLLIHKNQNKCYINIKNQKFFILRMINVNKIIDYFIIKNKNKYFCFIIKKVNRLFGKKLKLILYKFYPIDKLKQKLTYKLTFFNNISKKVLTVRYKTYYNLKDKFEKKDIKKSIIKKVIKKKHIIPLIKQLKNSKYNIKKKIKKLNLKNNKYEKIFNMHLKDKKTIIRDPNKYIKRYIINDEILHVKKDKIRFNLLTRSLQYNTILGE